MGQRKPLRLYQVVRAFCLKPWDIPTGGTAESTRNAASTHVPFMSTRT